MQFLASGTHTTGVSFYNALLWQQIRFASKRPLKPKIRGTPHTKHVPRPVAPTKLDRPPPTPSTSAASTANGQAVATSAENAAGAVGRSVQLVEERIEYLYKGEKMPNPRVIWAVGLAMFVVLVNSADIVRRPLRQPLDPNEPRVESMAAWKRWGIAGVIASSGVAIMAYAIYWPTRMVKRLDLVSRGAARSIPAPGSSTAARSSTPYAECELRINTLASSEAPYLFRARTYPLADLTLLGPLSSEPKRYHPVGNTAFEAKNRKRGKYPSSIPLKIKGRWDTMTILRNDSHFEDLEGLEKALLAKARPPTKTSPAATAPIARER